MCPLQVPLPRAFLQQPLTVLTRQVVRAISQSRYLRCGHFRKNPNTIKRLYVERVTDWSSEVLWVYINKVARLMEDEWNVSQRMNEWINAMKQQSQNVSTLWLHKMFKFIASDFVKPPSIKDAWYLGWVSVISWTCWIKNFKPSTKVFKTEND
jgi:hypothetical protein